MGINNLNLPPDLISMLYPESLVLVAVPEMALAARVPSGKPGKSSEIKPAYAFLGGNQRNVCFLVDSPGELFISPASLLFLEKILVACKCGLEDIAIVNTNLSELRLGDLRSQLNPAILFLWGVPGKRAGLKQELADFQVSLVDGMSVVAVSSPELLEGNSSRGTELKQLLWKALKKVFKL